MRGAVLEPAILQLGWIFDHFQPSNWMLHQAQRKVISNIEVAATQTIDEIEFYHVIK